MKFQVIYKEKLFTKMVQALELETIKNHPTNCNQTSSSSVFSFEQQTTSAKQLRTLLIMAGIETNPNHLDLLDLQIGDQQQIHICSMQQL